MPRLPRSPFRSRRSRSPVTRPNPPVGLKGREQSLPFLPVPRLLVPGDELDITIPVRPFLEAVYERVADQVERQRIDASYSTGIQLYEKENDPSLLNQLLQKYQPPPKTKPRVITGNVVNSNNEPVSYAPIYAEDLIIGFSDVEGAFSVSVYPGTRIYAFSVLGRAKSKAISTDGDLILPIEQLTAIRYSEDPATRRAMETVVSMDVLSCPMGIRRDITNIVRKFLETAMAPNRNEMTGLSTLNGQCLYGILDAFAFNADQSAQPKTNCRRLGLALQYLGENLGAIGHLVRGYGFMLQSISYLQTLDITLSKTALNDCKEALEKARAQEVAVLDEMNELPSEYPSEVLSRYNDFFLAHLEHVAILLQSIEESLKKKVEVKISLFPQLQIPQNIYAPAPSDLPPRYYPKAVYELIKDSFFRSNTVEQFETDLLRDSNLRNYFALSGGQERLKELLKAASKFFVTGTQKVTPNEIVIQNLIKRYIPQIFGQDPSRLEMDDIATDVYLLFTSADDCAAQNQQYLEELQQKVDDNGIERDEDASILELKQLLKKKNITPPTDRRTSGRCAALRPPIVDQFGLLTDEVTILGFDREIQVPSRKQKEVIEIIKNAIRSVRSTQRRETGSDFPHLSYKEGKSLGLPESKPGVQQAFLLSRDPFEEAELQRRLEKLTSTFDAFKDILRQEGEEGNYKLMAFEAHQGERLSKTGDYLLSDARFQPRPYQDKPGEESKTSTAYEHLFGERYRYTPEGMGSVYLVKDPSTLILHFHGNRNEPNLRKKLEKSKGRVLLLDVPGKQIDPDSVCSSVTLPGTPVAFRGVIKDERTNQLQALVDVLEKVPRKFYSYRLPDVDRQRKLIVSFDRLVEHPCPTCCKILEEVNKRRQRSSDTSIRETEWQMGDLDNIWQELFNFVNFELSDSDIEPTELGMMSRRNR